MKKIVALFMAVLYLSVSSGLAIEIHECMGRMMDFSLLHTNSDTCDSCGMSKGSKNCCKSELKFVKLQDSSKLLNTNYELSVPECNVYSNHFLINNNYVVQASILGGSSHSPPGYSSTSLCLLNCVFRI
jgi:hypothetical protein